MRAARTDRSTTAPPPDSIADARRQPLWRRRPGRVIVGAFAASTTDQVSLAAAGCAFYATLALFPAISVLISVYGLAFNVRAVEQQLLVLRDLLPPPAFDTDRRSRARTCHPAQRRAQRRPGVSLALTFWSAATGTKSVLSALNVAYDATEQRSLSRFQLIGLADDAVRGHGGGAGDRGAGVRCPR